MKRKILILLTLVLLLIPNVVKAACTRNTCSGPVGGAEGISHTVTGLGGYVPCNQISKTGICWWGAGDGSADQPRTGGVRVTIYSYKKGGTPERLGTADVWTNYLHTWGNFHVTKTSAVTDTLKRRKNCSLNVDRNDTKNTYNSFKKYADSEAVYISNTKYNGYNLADSLDNGNLPNWLYNKSKKKGWLEDNFFKYLRNGDYKTVKKNFKMSDSNIQKMRQNIGNLYVVAEILIQINVGDKDLYSGTVSEYGYLSLWGRAMDSLQVTAKTICDNKGKIGELVDMTKSSYLKVNGKTNKNCSSTGYTDKGYYSNKYGDGAIADKQTVKNRLCNNTYGLGIWYVPDCCEECNNSCETTCEGYTEAALEVCAKSYCSVPENNYDGKNSEAECIQSCQPNKCSGLGCSSKTDNKCSVINNKTSTKKSSVCSTTTMKADTLAETKICYEVNNESSEINNDMNRVAKIECTEKAKIDSLPSYQKVVVNPQGTANFNFAYVMDYTKKCQLLYRTAGSCTKYDTKYAGSQLEKDIKDVQKLINDNEKIVNNPNKYSKDEVETAEKMLTNAKDRLNNLKSYKNKLEKNLETYSMTDTKGNGTSFSNELELTVVEENGSSLRTKKQTLTLEPVYCVTGEKTLEKYCDYETNTYYKIKQNSVTCLNSNGEEKKATINDDNTESDYHKRVYYSLPSSFVEALTDNSGKIWHDEKECSTHVKDANGRCIEKENTWQFDPITSAASIDTYNNKLQKDNYTLRIKGYGSCAQFEYEYSCGYEFESISYCSNKCQKYKVGSDDFNKCIADNCGCDKLCGGNVVCQNKYCPEVCDGCKWEERSECPTIETCDTSKCNKYKSGSDEYKKCIADECTCDFLCGSDAECVEKYCPPPGGDDDCEDKCNKNYKPGSNEYNKCIVECGGGNGKCENKCKKYKSGSDEYNKCIVEECGCEELCGSNVDCQIKYCPKECDDCDTIIKDDCSDKCSKNDLTCIYDSCCRSECNGNVVCVYNCCTSECDEKHEKGQLNDTEYNQCLQECSCQGCGDGVVNDYVYRTVDVNNPFPDREAGKNWYNKVEYITDNNQDDVEYQISLSSNDLKKIREQFGKELTYKSYNRAKNVAKNSLIYCSEALHGTSNKLFSNLITNKDNACAK